jgi:WD40 repeat protein
MDTLACRRVRKFSARANKVNDIEFSPDGHKLLSGDVDGNGVLWDVSTGQKIHRFVEDNSIQAVVWFPDGQTVATASGNSVNLWNTASYQTMQRVIGSAETAHCLAISPDGKMLAFGGTGSKVDIWTIHE